ncbi:MAG TPA: hypothetical protein GX531_07470, partial [Methanothermobacter sp.]|nr:hypothetical protein [Methanothermobacter sp.]
MYPIDVVSRDVFLSRFFPCQLVATGGFMYLQRMNGNWLDNRHMAGRAHRGGAFHPVQPSRDYPVLVG